MARLTALALRVVRAVLVVLLAGSVLVQALMVVLLVIDPEDGGELAAYQRALAVVIAVLGLVTIQVVLVCVWRLVAMVRGGTVFSHAAFRYVDVVIAAIVAAALLVFALAVILVPGEAVPPGGIVLVCGTALAVLGVALIVLVLRMLLAQAVERDVEATEMRAELDEVI